MISEAELIEIERRARNRSDAAGLLRRELWRLTSRIGEETAERLELLAERFLFVGEDFARLVEEVRRMR